MNTVLRNFVGGSCADPADGVTAPVVDPCTGAACAHAPVSSAYGFEEYTRIKHVMSYVG